MSARVLVVPDSLKGTMMATTVATASSDGATSLGGEAITCQSADWCEGTAGDLQSVILGCRRRRRNVAPGESLPL